MSSSGNGSMMLIRQFKFPDDYQDNEHHILVDHDRLCGQDCEKVYQCFKKHTGTGELGLENWIRQASDQEILEFILELFSNFNLKVEYSWTGYRVVGSVHRGNGAPVWSLELFAKNPGSSTRVYSGSNNRESCTEA
ncbi:MAG: hypothetical protein WC666_03135 [Candidatus Paceibacterota bacterium]